MITLSGVPQASQIVPTGISFVPPPGPANPVDAIRQFGPLVKDIHAKDGCYPSREDPYSLGAEKPIPEGDVDFPAIIKILKAENYKGALTIECELNASSKDYLAKTRKYLQNLIDKK